MMGTGVGGQIHGISLDSFLQMAQMEKTTGTLTIRSDNLTGRLYLLKGELIDADTGDLESRDAAYEIISWENATIEIENSCAKKDNNIGMPLMNILMEGLKIKDERIAAKRAAVMASEAPSAVSQKDLSRPAEKVTDAEREEARATAAKMAAARPAKKGFPVKWAVLAGVLVIGAVAAGLMLFKTSAPQEEYQRLLAAMENQTDYAGQIAQLKAFIASYEESEFAQNAREKIAVLENLMEEQTYDAVVAKVDALARDDAFASAASALYAQYLEKYPEGRFSEETKQKIAEIPYVLEAADFEKVQAASESQFDEKVAIYTDYLKRHTEGKNVEAVRKLLADMSASFYGHLKKNIETCERNESWTPCIALCDSFINAFKEDPQYEEVVALKLKFQNQQALADLRRESVQKEPDYQAARQVYVDYLTENPDTLLKMQLEAAISQLDEKVAMQNEWNQTAAFVDNADMNVLKRIAQLERFIEKYPAGSHTGAAKMLMAKLQDEKNTYLEEQRRAAEEERKQARIRQETEKRQREMARKQQILNAFMAQVRQSGSRFQVNTDGTVTDLSTGLTWTLLDSGQELGQCLNYPSAKNYIEGLATGGHRDWRLPTAGELAGLYKNKPFFPSGGTPWYWSSEAYVKGYHKIANIVTTRQETVFNIEQERQDQCGAVRGVRP